MPPAASWWAVVVLLALQAAFVCGENRYARAKVSQPAGGHTSAPWTIAGSGSGSDARSGRGSAHQLGLQRSEHRASRRMRRELRCAAEASPTRGRCRDKRGRSAH